MSTFTKNIFNMGTFQITFFPIFGLMLGVNFASGQYDAFEMNEDERMIQIMFLVFGVSILWLKQNE
jgi:hypothetical protein